MSLSIGSDQLITLTGLTDNVSGSYQNSATVNGALLDAGGNTVTTFALNYVATSNGNYEGFIPATTTSTLTSGAVYQIKITVTVSGNTLVIYHSDYAQQTQA